jgi:hypothetical protein
MYGNWIITVQFDIGAPEAINLGTGKRLFYCCSLLGILCYILHFASIKLKIIRVYQAAG